MTDQAGRRRSAHAPTLLELDPELGAGLGSKEKLVARRVRVPVVTAGQGAWHPDRPLTADSGDLGFLVVDGLLMRRVLIGETRCTELLGPGDLLRPWSMDADDVSSVPVEADWRVVDRPASFAVIDHEAMRQLGAWPQITCELVDRVLRRARWLSFQLAVCHTRQIRRRLLMILWHFADRWGRVTPEGIVLQLRLSHRTLAEIVGSRRPTVTTAISGLREEGVLSTQDDGTWLLLGEPPVFIGQPALGGSSDSAGAPSWTPGSPGRSNRR